MNNSQQMAFYNERNKVTRLSRFDAEPPDLQNLPSHDISTHPGYTINISRRKTGVVDLKGMRRPGFDENNPIPLQEDTKNNPDLTISMPDSAVPHVFTALRNLLPAFDKILPERQSSSITDHERPIHNIIAPPNSYGDSRVASASTPQRASYGPRYLEHTHTLKDNLETLPGIIKGMSKVFGSIFLQHLLDSEDPSIFMDAIENEHGVHPAEHYLNTNNTRVPYNYKAIGDIRTEDNQQVKDEIARKHAAVEHLVPHLERYLQHIFDTGKDHNIHEFLAEHHEGKPELMHAFSALLRGE